MDFPENMPQERFQSLIHSFFKLFENEIIQIFLFGDNNHFKQDIINVNLMSLSKLKSFSEKHNCISFINGERDIKYLRNVGLDKTDAVWVDEASQLSSTLKDDVNFVTFDNGILELKNVILKVILDGKVNVSSPIEFVSVNN